MDLKLSGLRYRQEELEDGHALQIALYASLLGKRGKKLPPTGFFILEDGQLLTTERQGLPRRHRRGWARRAGDAEGLRGGLPLLAEGARGRACCRRMQEGLDWEAAVDRRRGAAARRGLAGAPPAAVPVLRLPAAVRAARA